MIPCVMSMIALLCRRNVRPTIGWVTFSKITKFSLNLFSPTSNASWTIPVGVSSCPFATCILNCGAGYSSFKFFGVICLIFLTSVSDIMLKDAPESTNASKVISSKSSGTYNMRFRLFSIIVANSGITCSAVSSSFSASFSISVSGVVGWISSTSFSVSVFVSGSIGCFWGGGTSLSS